MTNTAEAIKAWTASAAKARAAKAAKQGTLEERFWRKVDIRGPDECWPWKAAPRRKDEGYGAFWLNGRHQPANRVALELTTGPLAEGMKALHRCDNPPCCNPAHLFAGTAQDNMSDKVSKGRQVTGSRTGRTSLTEEEALAIRRTAPLARTPNGLKGAVADQFGVSKRVVQDIWAGTTWRHVK